MKKIAIAADHGGYELKEVLKKHYAGQGVDFIDLGTASEASVDYPDYAAKMADAVLFGKSRGRYFDLRNRNRDIYCRQSLSRNSSRRFI